MTMNVLECYDLWHQARAIHPDDPKRQNAAFMEALVAFAELVAAAEREACARLCQTEWSTIDEMATGKVFAAAIRARGAA
jgi:hypothetical protein